MVEDRENQYRDLLEEDMPNFTDHVNTPWESVPDVLEYNHIAYKRITQTLKQLEKDRATARKQVEENALKPDSNANSTKGILVLGQPGSGKTHLLMRVAQTLSKTNHVMFAGAPSNQYAIFQHIWSGMLMSLSRKLPSGRGRSQLDDLLAHVFRDILVPGFKADIAKGKDAKNRTAWVAKLEEDPYNLFSMLGTPAMRAKSIPVIRKRTLTHLQNNYSDKIDQHVADALISYCLESNGDRKSVLLNWLSGLDIDGAMALKLGLPPTWADCEKEVDDAGVRGTREARALKSISTIAWLSTHYQPLILALDQLESVRLGGPPMILKWGNAIREIATQAPNILMVTCLFPLTWGLFLDLAAKEEDCQSALDRIAQVKVELNEPFSAQCALHLLRGRMAAVVKTHGLPTDIYPFEEADVMAICQFAPSPRKFLNAANDSLMRWIDGLVQVSKPVAPVFSREAIEKLLNSELIRRRADFMSGVTPRIPGEDDFIGQVTNIFEAAFANSAQTPTFAEAKARNRVMPSNILVRGPDNSQLCVAICNAYGNSLAALVKNFVHEFHAGKLGKAVLLRDKRCPRPVGVTDALLTDYTNKGGIYHVLSRDEFGLVNAMYGILIDIKEHDLTIGDHKIDKKELVQFLHKERTARQSQFLRLVADKFEPLSLALNAGRIPVTS